MVFFDAVAAAKSIAKKEVGRLDGGHKNRLRRGGHRRSRDAFAKKAKNAFDHG